MKTVAPPGAAAQPVSAIGLPDVGHGSAAVNLPSMVTVGCSAPAVCWEYVPPVGGANYSVEEEPTIRLSKSRQSKTRKTLIRTIVESVEADSRLHLQLEFMCH